MGYYSTFKIRCIKLLGDFDTDLSEHLIESMESIESVGLVSSAELKKVHVFNCDGESYKWYSCDDDMTQISLRYPDIFFEIERLGEEAKDCEKIYILNGVKENVIAEIVYPKTTLLNKVLDIINV